MSAGGLLELFCVGRDAPDGGASPAGESVPGAGKAYRAPIPAMLAPMAGFTDAPFRALCRSFLVGSDGGLGAGSHGGANGSDGELGEDSHGGASGSDGELDAGSHMGAIVPLYTVTEMVSAAAIHYNDKKTAALARLDANDFPTAVQIFGHTPDFIAEAARRIASGELCGRAPAAIDINMGCPMKKIVSAGDGSVLMRSPALCGEIVRAAVEAALPFGVPVTVKIRLGFSREEQNAPQVARECAAAGASAICVHGRTREQMYSGEASLDGIARVREAVDPAVPVIGNGDVRSRADAERMIAFCGVDGVAVGRAALTEPWIFASLADADHVPPDERGRKDIAMRLVRSVCAKMSAEGAGERAETGGVIACRARLGFLLAGMRDAAAMRRALNSASTLADVERILG